MTKEHDVEEGGRTALVTERSAVARALAAAGIVGPILFTIGIVVQEFLRRGEYSPIAEQISALEGGPYGWVQQVNFVVFGLLTIGWAVGLHLGVRPARAGLVGPAILVWSGVGLMVGGVFPLREDALGRTYDPIGVHSVNGPIFFLSIAVGMSVLSRRLAADARWRTLASYTLATGIALLSLFIATGVFVRAEGAPLQHEAGLVQRTILAVWFPCIIVLALKLRRLAKWSGEESR